MERNARITLQGVVTSAKMNKTIVVLVETHKKHAKYSKRVKYASKYYAHDENNVANVGDTVKVHVRGKEGNRERIQIFEGIIIKVH